MSPRRPPEPGSTGGARTPRARADGTGAPVAKRAAAKKRPAEGQALKKAAPKKTVVAKNTGAAKKTPSAEAARLQAKQKRASAQARARTVAAGSPISHAPHKNRSRTAPSRTTASRSGGIRPANSRPGSARPRAGTAVRGARKRGFGLGSGRPVWVLGAVGVMLALLILPYFQKWLVQRSELEATLAEVSQATQDVADLEKQNERWKDDDYVRAQARARLNYVMPGEIGYVTSDPPATTGTTTPDPAKTDVPAGTRSWFSNIWLSAEAAGAEGEAQATTVVP